jgi:hypothetical protein
MLGAIVNKYLHSRLNVSLYALINDWAWFGSPLEAIEYRKAVSHQQEEAEAIPTVPQQRGQPVQIPGIPQRE